MKYFISCLAAFVLGALLLQGGATASERNYPGKELNGTWEVVKWDFHGVKGMDSPEVKEFFSSSHNSAIILPVGQIIGFWLTGERTGFITVGRRVSGYAVGMKLFLPISNDVCNVGAWKYLCNDNGNVDLSDKDLKNDIKGDALVVTDSYQGMLNLGYPLPKSMVFYKKLWPNIKNFFYDLNMNDGGYIYSIFPTKNKDEIIFFAPGKGESWFGVVLRRVK